MKTGKDAEPTAVTAEIDTLTEENKAAVAVAKEGEALAVATLAVETEAGDQPSIDAAQAVVDASSALVKTVEGANTAVIPDLVKEAEAAAPGGDAKVLKEDQAQVAADVTKKVQEEVDAIVKVDEAELALQTVKGDEAGIATA